MTRLHPVFNLGLHDVESVLFGHVVLAFILLFFFGVCAFCIVSISPFGLLREAERAFLVVLAIFVLVSLIFVLGVLGGFLVAD